MKIFPGFTSLLVVSAPGNGDPVGQAPARPEESGSPDVASVRARAEAILEEAGLGIGEAIEPALRNAPTTEKGRDTVERLIDAGLDVVARDGVRAVNTRSVALEAGVNIATLYQYFEEIESLLLAATLRDQSLRSLVLSSLVVELAEGKPAREWVDELVELMVVRTVESERRQAVVTITLAVPATRPVIKLAWETGAKLLAVGLSSRFGEDPDDYWLPITRAIHSTARLVIDDVTPGLPEDRDRLDQMVQMCWEYLERRIPEGSGTLD